MKVLKKQKNSAIKYSLIFIELLGIAVVVLVFWHARRAKAVDPLPADVNLDGIVNQTDLSLVKTNYNNSPSGIPSPSRYDVNGDQKINALDLAIVEDQLGNGTSPDRDYDKDTYSVAAGDCNDRNAAVHPLASEIANAIDDDCDTRVDNIYQPLSSNQYYDVTFTYERLGGVTTPRTVTDVVYGSLSSPLETDGNGAGRFVFELADASGAIIDTVSFSLPVVKQEIVKDAYGQYAVNNVSLPQSGTMTVRIPKSDSVKTIRIRDRRSSFNLTVNVSGAHPAPTGYINQVHAAGGISDCPPYLTAAGITNCSGLDQWPKADAELGVIIRDLKTFKPEMYLSLKGNSVVVVDPATLLPGVWGWFMPDNTLTVNPEHPETTIEQIARNSWNYLADLADDARTNRPEAKATIKALENFYCNGDPLKCIFDPDRLLKNFQYYSDLYCAFRKCVDITSAPYSWYGQDAVDPLHPDKSSPSGPRPHITGVFAPIQALSAPEAFAAFQESIFYDKGGPAASDELEKLTDILGPKSLYFETFVQDGSTGRRNLTSAMTSFGQVFGNAGLITDWDHDGVPDDTTNGDDCSPFHLMSFCSKKVNNSTLSICFDPDQRDKNRDGRGDACDWAQ